MRATQKALQEAATHQETNARIQQKMLELNKEQTSIQIFENLFFSLLQEKNNIVSSLVSGSKQTLRELTTKSDFQENKIIDIMRSKGKESIKDNIILFKESSNYDWEIFYEKSLLDIWGVYFRLNYQIVKLIDENETLKLINPDEKKKRSGKQKQYFDIFRATFSAYEYEAIFFNCISKYGNGKFKELLERYGMFEPMFSDINKKNEKKHPLTKYAFIYDEKIFEENADWIVYFKHIKIMRSIGYVALKKALNSLKGNIYWSCNISAISWSGSAPFNDQPLEKKIEIIGRKSSDQNLLALLNNKNMIDTIDFIIQSKLSLKDLFSICFPVIYSLLSPQVHLLKPYASPDNRYISQ